MKSNIDLLLVIAKLGAIDQKVSLTTTDISKKSGFSQQTASRKLISLAKHGLIERYPNNRGVEVELTHKGKGHLKQKYFQLKKLLEKKKLVIKAVVSTGLGEGKYYIRKKDYYKQFIEKLKIKPFAGTLNLEVDNDSIAKIKSVPKIIVNGFKDQNRSFGNIDCYRCTLKNTLSYIIFPERSSHPSDIIEVISEVNFRQKFGFKDNQVAEIYL
jgi:riboflavin kinase, archaea type